MRALLKILASLAVGVLCTYLVVARMEWSEVRAQLLAVPGWAVALYVATLVPTHYFRAARWKYLLRPLGVTLPRRQLLLISSAGFMAILALPFRLGEFVRPYLLLRQTGCRMSKSLGTVAVERIVDGLLISILLFVTYLLSTEAFSRPVDILGGAALAGFAWLSLLLFLGATLFLAFAFRWPTRTVNFALSASLLSRLAPNKARKLGEKLTALIHGFQAISRARDLVPFLVHSLLYWGWNGLGLWWLARGMGLPISPVAAFAMMAFTGVVITLPNSPGLVGQFQVGMVAVLSAFLPAALVASKGGAYAIVVHALQALWYLGVGLLCLRFLGGRGTLGEAVRESNRLAERTSEAADAAPAAADTGVSHQTAGAAPL